MFCILIDGVLWEWDIAKMLWVVRNRNQIINSTTFDNMLGMIEERCRIH